MTARLPVQQAGHIHGGGGSHYYVPAILWGRMAFCGPAPSGRPALGLVGICILVGRPSAGRPLGAGPQVTNLPHIRHSWPSKHLFGVATGQIGGAPC